MKNSFKKILLYEVKGIPHEYQIAAFLLPVFLLGVIFTFWKVHPVGDVSLLTCDLFHQYAPILAEIRSKIVSGESLFYTWNMGLGTNFWPILTYNGASPLNILLLLFPRQYLSDGITLLILLRTGLSGLFFSLMCYKKDGNKGPMVLALSAAYALCGYAVAYFWVLMWMDAVVLLPLVVLGLYKLFAGDKPVLYVVSLFLLIFSNFYMGFYVCVFLVFFAPILYREAYENSILRMAPIRAGLNFGGYSILAAGMTSVLLVPTFLALKNTSAARDTLTLTEDMSFTFFDFLSRFLLNADPVIRDGLPNVYVGVAILLLIPLYAFCSKIPFSRRAATLGLGFFLYISMSSPVLNFFWHGMHYTNQLPYRQAFLVCFLLLYMASQVLLNMESLSPRMIFYTGAAVLFYLVILDQSVEKQKNYWLIYGSAIILIAYITILSGFFTTEKSRGRARKAFLYVMILELFLASELALSYIEKNEHFTYAPSYGQFESAIIKDIEAADGSRFARTALIPTLTGNDGALYHVKTIPVFASTTSMNFVQFMDSLGFANNQEFEVTADGMTEVTARLLGIRNTINFIEASPPEEEVRQEPVGMTSGVFGSSTITEAANEDVIYSGYRIDTNENILPIGFYVPLEAIQPALNRTLSPFEQTNALLTNMGARPAYAGGSLELVSAANIVKDSAPDVYTITTGGQTATISLKPGGIPADRDILLYIDTSNQPTVRITRIDGTSGGSSITVLTPELPQIINCGKADADGASSVTIQMVFMDAVPETFSIYCSSIDEQALDAVTSTLAEQPLTVTSYDSSHLTGTVDFAGNGALFTTIPYDKGWTVKVDGQKVTAQAAYGALLSVSVSKGIHEIKFSYQPPGFWAGLLISLILTADFAALCLWNPFSMVRRHKTRKEFDSIVEKEELQ